MININGKTWEKLKIEDIKKLLDMNDDETFFFEYKNDKITPKDLIKEISAMANTYGGYIFIGIENDKRISGCTQWNEERIMTTIHECITPIPNFDIKKVNNEDGKIIYIVKIEEGSYPPYITNFGKIYERVSSGSFPIKDSIKLTQLYYKREEQLKKIKNKIEIDDTNNKNLVLPQNLCGYLDIGFSININDLQKFQRNFLECDLEKLSKKIKEENQYYSITRVGYSIIITIGKSESIQNGQVVLSNAGINNFIEIMYDGSVRCRMILCSDETSKVNINGLLTVHTFKEIYSEIVGKEFYSEFISAYKYEKLTVIRQFEPYFKLNEEEPEYDVLKNYMASHKEKYGGNIIVIGNRIPKNDYICIDKRYFNNYNIEYNNDNLMSELFGSLQIIPGFIGNI